MRSVSVKCNPERIVIRQCFFQSVIEHLCKQQAAIECCGIERNRVIPVSSNTRLLQRESNMSKSAKRGFVDLSSDNTILAYLHTSMMLPGMLFRLTMCWSLQLEGASSMSIASATVFNHCIWRSCLCTQLLEEKIIFILLNCFDRSRVPVSNTFLPSVHNQEVVVERFATARILPWPERTLN